MAHFLLFYDYVDDMLNRRTPYREDHLALVHDVLAAGTLRMAGALSDPLDGAVFVFQTDEASVVEDFVRCDPYVAAGLVPTWRVRLWNVVTGG